MFVGLSDPLGLLGALGTANTTAYVTPFGGLELPAA